MNKHHLSLGLTSLLFSLLGSFSSISYGYGMSCDKPVLGTVGAGTEQTLSFNCVNTTGVTFGAYHIYGLNVAGVEINPVGCNYWIAPGQSCAVTGTFTPSNLGTNIIDFDDMYGGERHYGIFCNNPSKGCIEVTGTFSEGALNGASCIGSGTTAQCIAVGEHFPPNLNIPVIAQSLNGGTRWSIVTSGLNSTKGTFNAASCTGSGAAAQCIAAGVDDSTNLPLLAQSQDGGQTWTVVNTGISHQGFFSAASCTGSGATAQCIAAGEDDSTGLPLLAQSQDGGSWTVVNTGISHQGFFNAASCTGSGATAQCIAAGEDDSTGLPLLAQSQDGGSWTVVNTGISHQGSFYAASCTGSGATAQCIAAGRDESTGLPLLAQSQDGGHTWTVVNTGISDQGHFNAASCTGSGATAQCIAAGEDDSTPLLAQSQDGGSWTVVNTGISHQGSFNAASCTGNGATAQCIAAGRDESTGLPLLAQSQDGGQTWTVVNTGISDSGFFNAASCTGNGATAQCIAAGEDDSTPHRSLLAQSLDGGKSWNTVPE